ncbi:MAG: hypothetical protein RLO50_11090 [Azospirillaceae bacterium]
MNAFAASRRADVGANNRPRLFFVLAITIQTCCFSPAASAQERLPPADYVRFAIVLGCIAEPMTEIDWVSKPMVPGSLIEEAAAWNGDGRLAPLLASVDLSSGRFFQLLDLARRDAVLWTDLRTYLITSNEACS